MKIVSDKCIYVQERDLELLLKNNKSDDIPNSVMESYHNIICGKSDSPLCYRKFDDEEAFNFFNSQDYILDKTFIDHLSWTDTINYGSITLLELSQAFKDYEKINENVSKEEVEKIENRLDLLRYKMGCIKEAINEKKSKITLVSYENAKGKKKTIRKIIKNNK